MSGWPQASVHQWVREPRSTTTEASRSRLSHQSAGLRPCHPVSSIEPRARPDGGARAPRPRAHLCGPPPHPGPPFTPGAPGALGLTGRRASEPEALHLTAARVGRSRAMREKPACGPALRRSEAASPRGPLAAGPRGSVTPGPAPRPRRSRRGRALAPEGRDSISETNEHPSACHPTKTRTRTCRLALPRVRSGPRRRAADTGGQLACHSPASRGVPASIPGARAGRGAADAAGRGRAAVSSGAGRASSARPRRAPTARRAASPGAERSGGAGLPRQLPGARASHRRPLGSCLGVQFPPEPGPGRARAGGGGPQTVPLLIQVNKAMDGKQSPPGSLSD